MNDSKIVKELRICAAGNCNECKRFIPPVCKTPVYSQLKTEAADIIEYLAAQNKQMKDHEVYLINRTTSDIMHLADQLAQARDEIANLKKECRKCAGYGLLITHNGHEEKK